MVALYCVIAYGDYPKPYPNLPSVSPCIFDSPSYEISWYP